VTLPDVKGRQEILELYISKITHDIAIDVGFWAKKTSGFSGADLQNLVNTAAIRAAVEGKFCFIDIHYFLTFPAF
jgi:ATP-dependent metalloprotease